jgi:hypothetical protein
MQQAMRGVHNSRASPSAADAVGCRVRYPQHWAPFALMAASAVPHAPFSIALHSMIGVSERTRDTLRTLDVFFILTCGGEHCIRFAEPAGHQLVLSMRITCSACQGSKRDW